MEKQRASQWLLGFGEGVIEAGKQLKPMIEQFCRDLNSAHNEILRLQGVAEKDFYKYDWPEWSPQANSIRWAEKLIHKRLAKTDHWTLYPSKKTARKSRCSSGAIVATDQSG